MNGQLQAAGARGVSFASDTDRRARPTPSRSAARRSPCSTGQAGLGADAQHQSGRDRHAVGAEHRPGGLRRPDRRQHVRHHQVTGQKVAADAQSQLLKFDASGASVVAPTKPPYAAPDQISTTALGSQRQLGAGHRGRAGRLGLCARQRQRHARAARRPPGGQDVALQKYNSAGKLVFSSDLGSASSASGLSLAVSADGTQVAIAGQVTGSLTAGQTVNDPTGANSFVAVYDSAGRPDLGQPERRPDAEPGQRRRLRRRRVGLRHRPGPDHDRAAGPAGSPTQQLPAGVLDHRRAGRQHPDRQRRPQHQQRHRGRRDQRLRRRRAERRCGRHRVRPQQSRSRRRWSPRATWAAWAAAPSPASRCRTGPSTSPATPATRRAERRHGDQRRARQRSQRLRRDPLHRPGARRRPTPSPTTAARRRHQGHRHDGRGRRRLSDRQRHRRLARRTGHRRRRTVSSPR